jgi:hypothetical protein
MLKFLLGIAASFAVFFLLPLLGGSQASGRAGGLSADSPPGYYAGGCAARCPGYLAGWFYGRGYFYRGRIFFGHRGRLEFARFRPFRR